MAANHEIIDQIGRAFSAPTLDAKGAFDEFGKTYPDANPYLDQIHGKSWREVDSQWLVKRSDALGFLGTRWLIALMPVYMISAVKDGVWSPATEMLVLILARPGAGTDSFLGPKRFAQLVDELTAEQRAVVGDVLRHIAEIDPEGSLGLAARGAVESCWNAYGRSSSGM